MTNANSRNGQISRRVQILIGATGAISVVNLPQYLEVLRRLNFDLRVVLTAQADEMLPAQTVGRFCSAAYHASSGMDGSHVNLAQWADLVIVLPCTAHTLALLAHGFAFNLLDTTALAHERPLLIFPMMNGAMWRNGAVQHNVATLEERGHIVVRPAPGRMYEVATRSEVMGLRLASPLEVGRMVVEVLRLRHSGTPDALSTESEPGQEPAGAERDGGSDGSSARPAQ